MNPSAVPAPTATPAPSAAPGPSIYTNYAQALSSFNPSANAYAGNTAAVGAQNDDTARANAAALAKVEAQKSQDAADPGKAQMVLLPNNQGYAFYDGTGQRMNINQYSLLTGKRPDEILADSPDAKDQKFVQDYKTLMALSNAWVNGDTKTLGAMRAADPKKFNQLISTYKSPADMVKAFTQHWSDYYGSTATNSPSTSSFSPQQIQQPNTTNKALAAGTDLASVLTPQPTTPKPQESFLDKINPFSTAHKATNAYNAEEKSNPWFAYNNSLYGK